MKIKTVQKLENIAKACVAGLVHEVRCGLTTPDMVRDIQEKTKNPTRLEVIKAMIRADLKKSSGSVSPLWKEIANAMKSSEQANYLANAIDARIKRRAWSDRSFDGIYRRLFGVRPHAVSAKKA